MRRVDCLKCGRVNEQGTRMTQRLVSWIEVLTLILPISPVRQLTGLHWQSIKDVDKRRLKHSL
jgi:hypothetical protein